MRRESIHQNSSQQAQSASGGAADSDLFCVSALLQTLEVLREAYVGNLRHKLQKRVSGVIKFCCSQLPKCIVFPPLSLTLLYKLNIPNQTNIDSSSRSKSELCKSEWINTNAHPKSDLKQTAFSPDLLHITLSLIGLRSCVLTMLMGSKQKKEDNNNSCAGKKLRKTLTRQT